MRLLFSSLLVLAVAGFPAAGQNYTIDTIAGGGLPENMPGLSANLGSIGGIATDKSGNTFLSLDDFHIVVKLDTAGNLTRIAGTGIEGTSGDNGPATSAQLDDPAGLAFDSHGNLYIGTNSGVRRISNGIITTLFSNDWTNPFFVIAGPRSIAIDSADNLYFSSADKCVIGKWSAGVVTRFAGQMNMFGFDGDNGPAVLARISINPTLALAVDAADAVYIADTGNNCIRKVAGGIITTVAGDPERGRGPLGYGDGGPATSALLSEPVGIAIDADGSLLIADAWGTSIRKVTNGIITTIAGTPTDDHLNSFGGDGGPATAAMLGGAAGPTEMMGLAFDSAHRLVIADSQNLRLRRISGGVINTIAGGAPAFGDSGPAARAQFLVPMKAVPDAAGGLYIADVSDNRVRHVSGGIVSAFAGSGGWPGSFSGDDGLATAAKLKYPYAVAFDSRGAAYIADCDNLRIRKVQNGVISTIAGNGHYQFNGDGVPAADAQIGCVTDLGFDAADNLYFVDQGNQRVRMISDGMVTTVAGNGTPAGSPGCPGGSATAVSVSPTAIAVQANGDFYVTSVSCVEKVSKGSMTVAAGNGKAGISGDNGPATAAQLGGPFGLAVDSAGALYIADDLTPRIRKVSNGIITTIAGDGTYGTGGDGGPALAAQFRKPRGLSAGPDGRIYVADVLAKRIRVLTPPTAPAAPPVLAIAMTHSGNFTQGQMGAVYTVTVSNSATASATAGTVTVTETAPTGLGFVAMTGRGWTCAANHCTRSDALGPGASYPEITVIVNVAASAPPSVTNQATVSGGGAATVTASDITMINMAAGRLQPRRPGIPPRMPPPQPHVPTR